MISAPNRPLPLSGNKVLFFMVFLLVLASCSPKIRPVVAVQPNKEPEKPVVSPPVVVKTKPAAPKVSMISLLLPFGLEHLQSGTPYTHATLKEADIALDYYRGFKLALDSLTGLGYNYKLLVFDSNDQRAQAHSLAANPAIRASNLIVGPVFPDDIKAFTATYLNGRQPIVSPLSASAPAAYNSAELITVTPPLEYHAWAAAKYVEGAITPKRIYILRSGFSEENEYIIPFKKAIDSLSKKKTRVIELTVIHGQLNSLLPLLSETDHNVFVVPSTNQHFLTVTLRTLDSLNNTYPVTLIGHPSWINFSFLKADLLQRLDTHITSSEQIDYKAANTITFMNAYRQAYHADATGFSIKGFDEGFYLGRLLATDSLKNITGVDYTGLHNSFHFQRKAGLGWINTHVDVLKYADFELKKVE